MRRRLVLALTNAAVSIGKAVPSAPEADYDRRSPCDLNRQPPVPRPGASAAAHPSGGLARSDFVSGVGGQQDEEAGCCADSYDALKGSSQGGPVSKAQAGGVSAGRFSAEAAALERGYRTGREHSRDPRTSERGAKAAGFTKKRRRETSRGSVAARELVTPEFVAHAMQWLVMLPFMIVVAESQVKCVGSHPEVERLQREAGVGSLDRRLRDKKDAQSPIFLECEFVGASGQRHNAQQNTTYIHTYIRRKSPEPRRGIPTSSAAVTTAAETDLPYAAKTDKEAADEDRRPLHEGSTSPPAGTAQGGRGGGHLQ